MVDYSFPTIVVLLEEKSSQLETTINREELAILVIMGNI